MVEIKTRTTINVHEKYFPIYQEILENPEWGQRDNLKLFTITVLIGKYIVGEQISLKNNSNTYLRVRDNDKKDDMTLLKCFAVLESGDINILKDEDAMFTLCENYTTAGIIKLKEWYDSNDQDIILTLSENLTDKFLDNKDKYFPDNDSNEE